MYRHLKDSGNPALLKYIGMLETVYMHYITIKFIAEAHNYYYIAYKNDNHKHIIDLFV